MPVERDEIMVGSARGESEQSIADRLDRAPSTIMPKSIRTAAAPAPWAASAHHRL